MSLILQNKYPFLGIFQEFFQRWFFLFFWWTSLLCIVGELVGWGLCLLLLAFETGNTWHLMCDFFPSLSFLFFFLPFLYYYLQSPRNPVSPIYMFLMVLLSIMKTRNTIKDYISSFISSHNLNITTLVKNQYWKTKFNKYSQQWSKTIIYIFKLYEHMIWLDILFGEDCKSRAGWPN